MADAEVVMFVSLPDPLSAIPSLLVSGKGVTCRRDHNQQDGNGDEEDHRPQPPRTEGGHDAEEDGCE